VVAARVAEAASADLAVAVVVRTVEPWVKAGAAECPAEAEAEAAVAVVVAAVAPAVAAELCPP
jgi:hypothetical protein